MDWIAQAASQLGVDEQTAKSGMGMLLKIAESHLGADFSKIRENLTGVDEAIQAAPEAGGVAGALGKVGSMFGGGAESVGDLAELASGFSSLDLSAGNVAQFGSVLISLLREHAGDDIASLVENALPVGD